MLISEDLPLLKWPPKVTSTVLLRSSSPAVSRPEVSRRTSAERADVCSGPATRRAARRSSPARSPRPSGSFTSADTGSALLREGDRALERVLVPGDLGIGPGEFGEYPVL